MADIYTTVAGNVTADPQIKYTNNGKAVTNVNIAANHRVKDGNEWKDGAATFVSGAVWEQMAENVCESICKGHEVAMTGWLYTEAFTRQDGTEGTALKMRVEHIGPTLRWGVTTYRKVDRRNGGGTSSAWQSAPQGTDWGTPQNQPPQQAPQSQPPADPWQGSQAPAFQDSSSPSPF